VQPVTGAFEGEDGVVDDTVMAAATAWSPNTPPQPENGRALCKRLERVLL
jgi:hypothetical protein